MELDKLMEDANKLGTEASKQTGVTFNPVSITSETLSSQKPYTLPETVASTTAEGMTGGFTATVEQGKAQLEADAQQAELDRQAFDKRQEQTNLVQQKQSKVGQLLGIYQDRPKVEEEFKVAEKNTTLASAVNELEASQRAQTNELRALEGQGLTPIQKQQKSGALNRRYAFEQADLAILANFAQRNYDAAVANSDRKVRLLVEPLEQELKYLDEFIKENNADLDDADARAFELRRETLRNQLDTAKETAETLEGTRLDLMFKAQESGAPQSVLIALSRAKDIGGLFSAMGSYGAKITGGLSPISGGDGTITGAVSGNTQAIIDNPSLFDDLTPTLKGKVISELQANGYDTTNLGVKGLSDTAIKEVAMTQKALSDLDELRLTISGNEQFIGPITGLQRFNPYSKARKIQADVDRVRQTVGKALEGGVLRKEDEEKYKKILATLADTPTTAIYKIDALKSSIQRDIENYKSLQLGALTSLNVSGSLNKKGTVTKPEDWQKKYNY